MRNRVAPKVSEGTLQDHKEYNHPAFGYVSFSHVQGGDTLFMSNIDHRNQVILRIGRAKMMRGLSHDRYFADGELIEVAMSPVQFADLLSNPNRGSGTPCTIIRTAHEGSYPSIDMKPVTARFSDEMNEDFKNLTEKLDNVIRDTEAALKDAKVSQAKQAVILAPIKAVHRVLTDHLPFLEDQFREAVEGIVVEAKSVVEQYAQQQGVDTPKLISQNVPHG